MNFTHLHLHTAYSLKDGVGKIAEYLKKAKEDGQTSMAITEHGNLYSHIEFYIQAKKIGINPIIGCEFYVCDNHLEKGGSKKGKKKKEEEASFAGTGSGYTEAIKKDRFHLTVLAKNNTGYQNLLKLISIANRDGYYYKPRVDKALLRQYNEGLIVLSGCLGSEINQYILHDMYDEAENAIKEYQDIFGDRFFLEVMNHEGDENEIKVMAVVARLGKKLGIKIVATNDAHYVNREDSIIQDAMIALRDNMTLNDPDLKKYKNNSYYFKTRKEMHEAFAGFEEYCENAYQIGEQCSVEIKREKLIFPSFIEGEENKKNLLREMCLKGWDTKIKSKLKDADQKKAYADRVRYELEVISTNHFCDYFLIVADIVRFATESNIPMSPGRGSVGGSLVAYLLGITQIDPLKYDLYFERFLNPGRISPPDIDLDFADNRRDEIIEYTKAKYGKDCFAKVLTFGNFQPRMALKDAFRVFGHPLSLQAEMAKLIPDVIQGLPNIRFRHLYGEDKDYPHAIQPALLEAREKYKNEFFLAEKLEGNPRHVSTHASAYIITDKDITEYAPLDYDAESKDVRIGIDMHSGDFVKLLKIDFLGIETLSILASAIELIKQNHGITIDKDNLDEDDKKTWDAICKGDTISIFQFESDGMRGLLKRAKPRNINELADCNAIYRPGAAKFIDDYCAVKMGRKQPSYFHEKMEPVLATTCAQMIYQEQVMKMCQELAGFTLPDADYMRKAIGKKQQADMDILKPKFSSGCKKNGIDEALVDKILDWFADMSRYNFNKSHAIGYSKNAYSAAYIKANYPFEFVLASFNKKTKELNDYLVRQQDAMKRGIKVNGPDINISSKSCDFQITTLDNGDTKDMIYFGLNLIKGVSSNTVDLLTNDINVNGTFKNMAEFLYRTIYYMDKNTLEGLLKSGALDRIGANRGIIGSGIEEYLKIMKRVRVRKARKPEYEFPMEEFNNDFFDKIVYTEVSKKDALEMEREVLGFYANGNPLDDYMHLLLTDEYVNLSELSTTGEGEYIKVGCIISDIRESLDKNGATMAFMELEDNVGKGKALLFASQYPKYKALAHKKIPVEISGKVSKGALLVNTIKKLKNEE